jgi:hypothetical protein
MTEKKSKKITSVLELSRYKKGEIVWWVALRYSAPIQLNDEDRWMLEVHPKTIYSGPYKPAWQSKSKLPKLHHSDFNIIVSLLSSELQVERFKIAKLTRSPMTGEFYYANDDDEWMPESCLCDTKEAAAKERTRILRLMKRWMEKAR